MPIAVCNFQRRETKANIFFPAVDSFFPSPQNHKHALENPKRHTYLRRRRNSRDAVLNNRNSLNLKCLDFIMQRNIVAFSFVKSFFAAAFAQYNDDDDDATIWFCSKSIHRTYVKKMPL